MCRKKSSWRNARGGGVKSVVIMGYALLATVCLPALSRGESWVEFHKEQWSQKSGKLKKKLTYVNRYFYDGDNVVRTGAGDVTLWIKEVSYNDSYYVKKGVPQTEDLFRKVHLWCGTKRYEILQDELDGGGANERISEEIKAKSYYEQLYKVFCEKK